jgi:poly(3-hydroxybutyrate) depolymerase
MLVRVCPAQVAIMLGISGALALFSLRSSAGAPEPPAVRISVPTSTTEAAPGRPALTPEGLYVPSALDRSRPVPILLALHGFSGSGTGIAARLRGCADQYGWLLVAPTMVYRDYFDPQQLREDAQDNLPRVHAMLESVRAGVTGLELAPELLVYGFSRGAQMAHRFSMTYPREVAAVAALSAGSYTLPNAEDATGRALTFPFGTADLAGLGLQPFDQAAFGRIPVWVGVGGSDANPTDTSRAWDAYEGSTRVERARAFVDDLVHLGQRAELHVFSGVGHEETSAMRAAACAFLDSGHAPVH